MNISAMSTDNDWEWFNQYTPVFRVEDSCGFVCRNDRGVRLGAAVFDNYTGRGGSIQGHFAIISPIVLKNGFISLCHDYCFRDRGVNVIYALVPSDNDTALRFNEKIGFKEVTRLPEAFPDGVASVILSMRVEDCKYG